MHGKKRCTVQNLFELVSDFRPNFGPKLGPKSCTHYTADKFDKSQKQILFLKITIFSVLILFFNWFLWFSTFFLSHSYFLMILRIQHIRFLGGIREIKGGIFCFLTPTIFLFTFEFSSQRLDSWANNPQHLIQK